jgi:stress response protein SCP2
MILISGQKVKLNELIQGLKLDVGMSFDLTGPGHIEVCCFGLDSDKQITDHRYFVYQHGQSSPDAAVRFLGPTAGEYASFEVNLEIIQPHIARLAFVAFINGPGALNQLSSGHFKVSQSGEEKAKFVFSGTDFTYEKAIIVGQVYRYDQMWRLSADGQGFLDGIEAIFRSYGGLSLFRELTKPVQRVVVVTPEQLAEMQRRSMENYYEEDEGPVIPVPPKGRTLH